MWLQAVVAEQDLTALLGELLPSSIRLGEDGELRLGEATGVSLVAGVGLRVVCGATLRWSVLGVHVPIKLASMIVVVRPEIVAWAGGRRLVFKIEIEHADVVGLPKVVDDGVTNLVNRELAARHAELAWDYSATLSHVFALPTSLQPPRELALTVVEARVSATGGSLALAVRFEAAARPRGTAVGPPAPPSHGSKSPSP
ncbi:MAG TPA: hypothetical protein VKU41_25170 [Polyangiaceae bacterium]|nr:hypothetical protein [Polyangiaceae bacterium]